MHTPHQKSGHGKNPMAENLQALINPQPDRDKKKSCQLAAIHCSDIPWARQTA